MFEGEDGEVSPECFEGGDGVGGEVSDGEEVVVEDMPGVVSFWEAGVECAPVDGERISGGGKRGRRGDGGEEGAVRVVVGGCGDVVGEEG